MSTPKRRPRNREDEATALNELLRAELSAVETYRRVVRRLEAKGTEIHRICEEHLESANLLIAQISELGGEPTDQASTWKNIQVIVEFTARPLEDPMTIKALKDGEEQDILTYQGALNRANLAHDLRYLIERMLLPRSRAHISSLERLLSDA